AVAVEVAWVESGRGDGNGSSNNKRGRQSGSDGMGVAVTRRSGKCGKCQSNFRRIGRQCGKRRIVWVISYELWRVKARQRWRGVAGADVTRVVARARCRKTHNEARGI